MAGLQAARLGPLGVAPPPRASLHRRRVCRALETSALRPVTVADVDKHQVVVVLGTQWGDEGKGKLVDSLAGQYDVVARAQGGANAGHTIYDLNGKKYALHLVPSGILNPDAICVVGNGVVVHVPGFFEEVDRVRRGAILGGCL